MNCGAPLSAGEGIDPVISQFFQKDHLRLDEIFISFQKNKKENLDLAKNNFEEFKKGLLRHIVWEEEILFPAFESKTGMVDSGPTAVMRFEHKQIKTHLHNISEYLQSGDVAAVQDNETSLLHILKMHNMKEEHALYPAIDRLTSAEEKAAILEKINTMPAASHGCCCGVSA